MSREPIELLQRLRRHATDMPNRIALREIATGRTMTWPELDCAVYHRARQSHGRVSLAMLRSPNSCDFHIAFLGILAAGRTVCPVSHDIVDAELKTITAKATTAQAGPAILLQSSGTMGLSKIARRDARSLDAVSASMVEAIGMTSSDQVLACVPLCHSYGLEHGLLAPLFAGATVHLAQGFDLPTICRELAASAITVFPAVPSIYEMLGNLADDGAARPPALRLAYSAGGPLPARVFEKVSDVIGIRVGQLYGATEIGSVTFAHPDDPNFDPASVGKAMRGVETKIDNDTGQLLVRAPSMMSDYIGDPTPLTIDGYFPTGDLAQIDPRGNITITGRLKLLIDVGGLKVNPLEVEQTLAQHPSVGSCVVVPMRLSETIFRLKAIVTPADERHPPASEELRRFARERLTAYKVPRLIEVRASLPRSATGKILRHLLVESASA
jgi:acyl-CoA synthetase (AMP-forming)/AMP-acid ligase II